MAERVKLIEAYYENERSNKNVFRSLCDFFGQPFDQPYPESNRANCKKIFKKLYQWRLESVFF